MYKTPSPRLPFELCEAVIDNLDMYEDKATLRACSLTCKMFLHVSRHHLFYHVHLHNARTAKRFLHTICSTNSLTTPTPFIRRLTIVEGRGRYKFEPRWLNEALPLLMTCLFEVAVLELSFLVWGLLDNAAQFMIISGFQKVKHLEMLHGKFETSEQMNQFIASFPSLTNLRCSQMYWKTDAAPEMPYRPLPSGLKTITLGSSQSIFFNRLLSLESHPNVRTVDFQYMYAKNTEGICKLLKTLGSSLEHLDLGDPRDAVGFKASNAEAVFKIDIDLAHNTSLRSIRLDYAAVFQPNGCCSMEWIFTLLSQITSSQLEHISLRLQVKAVSDLDTVDWDQIEHICTQWSGLQKLTISLHGPVDIVPIAELIKARLPVLNNCGLLYVRDRGKMLDRN